MPGRAFCGWEGPVRAVLATVALALAAGLVREPGPQGAATRAPRLVVDANTAPPAVLAALPSLGPGRVKAIVAAREADPFRSLDDLDARVKGIGPATMAAIRPYLEIRPNPPE
ncbi:MAG TPA: helix-hairpin-helix domain-containing protein [Isosphaeraceae bacterium]|jgi:competence protein ComEA|nr:helix-hairpin-helix domain-containing protein [Isosphaeraceae bacterium]